MTKKDLKRFAKKNKKMLISGAAWLILLLIPGLVKDIIGIIVILAVLKSLK